MGSERALPTCPGCGAIDRGAGFNHAVGCLIAARETAPAAEPTPGGVARSPAASPIKDADIAGRAAIRTRLDELILQHNPEPECCAVARLADRSTIALIERHDRGNVWLSLHPTLHDAATYHLINEDGGWEIIHAVDLATGEIHEPETAISWRQRRQ